MQNLFVTHDCLFNTFLIQRVWHVRYGTASGDETYYEILKVRPDSSTQEIKDAFVKLSKQFHPDVQRATKKDNQSAQFVKISEAYQILSKPKLRSSYDQDLLYRGSFQNTNADGMKTTEFHRPWEVKPNFDPNPGPYYGINGLRRVSNTKIALALVALGIFGAVFGFGSVKHSFTFNRQQLDEKSAAASLHHTNIRADAQKFGNEEQLRRMKERILNEKR